MPAAVAAIPAVIGGVSALGTTITGFSQASRARREAERIQQQIDNYRRQTLTNPFEELQVSTLGADRQREDLARSMATAANLAAMGGSRAIASLTPNLIAQQNAQEAQIVANLDEQEKQRQQLIAQGNQIVQQMTEQRERDDLLGLGNALNTANQNRTNANNMVVQGLTQLGGTAMAFGGDLFKGTPKEGTFGGDGALKTILPGAEVSPANPLPQNYQSPMPNSPAVFNIPQVTGNNGTLFNANPFMLSLNGMWNPFGQPL
ncbi:MAG: hypothetical protein LBE36_13600 [Flavobacteriaceae bacterium]|jgi:hypothetical protein|nr:hypothetical protein [Flavobacteriaceae bacterium]